MKSINLLPRVPYVVRQSRLFIIGIAAAGVLLVAIQLLLQHTWHTQYDKRTTELQQLLAEVRELTQQTTPSDKTAAYGEASRMIEQLKQERHDWALILQPLLGVAPLDGQIAKLDLSEDLQLSVDIVFLAENDVTDALKELEQAPSYQNMKLTITEHKRGTDKDKVKLFAPDGTIYELGVSDYFTLSLKIQLPKELGENQA